MKIYKLCLAGLIFLALSSSAFGYGNYGYWSAPNHLGDTFYSDSNGRKGYLRSPDHLGRRHFEFSYGSNKSRGYISRPDHLGRTFIYYRH